MNPLEAHALPVHVQSFFSDRLIHQKAVSPHTASILTKNRTFIPIPEEIKNDFLPAAGERKRLEVRCDVLYLVES